MFLNSKDMIINYEMALSKEISDKRCSRESKTTGLVDGLFRRD